MRQPTEAPDTYRNTQLEALSLESLIAPSLRRVGQFAVTREEATLQRAYTHAPMSPGGIGTSAPLRPERPPDMSAPVICDELVITPIPRRPALRRNAVSDRGRHQMPLRVQAVRRMHQEAMARALSEYMEEAGIESRRASQEEAETHTPIELHAWNERGAQLVRWDELDRLPDVSPEPQPFEERDVFAEAFAQVTFGQYEMSPQRTPMPQDVTQYPSPDERPFEFDPEGAYDNTYSPPHTVGRPRRSAGHFF
jgi:hypothetical protein